MEDQMSNFNISHGEHFLKVSLKSVHKRRLSHTFSIGGGNKWYVNIVFWKISVVETLNTRGQHFSHFAYKCAFWVFMWIAARHSINPIDFANWLCCRICVRMVMDSNLFKELWQWPYIPKLKTCCEDTNRQIIIHVYLLPVALLKECLWHFCLWLCSNSSTVTEMQFSSYVQLPESWRTNSMHG